MHKDLLSLRMKVQIEEVYQNYELIDEAGRIFNSVFDLHIDNSETCLLYIF